MATIVLMQTLGVEKVDMCYGSVCDFDGEIGVRLSLRVWNITGFHLTDFLHVC